MSLPYHDAVKGHLLLAVSSPQRTVANALIVCLTVFSFFRFILTIFSFLIPYRQSLLPLLWRGPGERPSSLI